MIVGIFEFFNHLNLYNKNMSLIKKNNALESEAIYIFREVISVWQTCVAFFGGKDSITLVRLAQKLFPAKIPFPLLHVDTIFPKPLS
jgi:sulfate adenylyltransferase subunit 2